MQNELPSYPIQYKPAADLQPYDRNARTHSRDQIEQLKELIRMVGFTNPVLGDERGLIAGHGRREAVLEMWEAGETVYGPGKRFELPAGMLPWIDGTGMSDQERQAFILADNQVALNSDWDTRLLRGELQALKAMDFDMAKLGFDTSSLVQFMAGPEREADPDELPEQPDPVTKVGDVWQLGEHRLICGDSTDQETVARLLGDVVPVLMVTDPPYGVNYDPSARNQLDDIERAQGRVENDDRADWKAAYELFPGAVAYVWHAALFGDVVLQGLRECGLLMRSQIVWAKPHYAIGRSHYHPQHECLIYAVRKGKTGTWQGGRKQSTVWQMDNGTFQGGKRAPEDERTGHGTQKPVEAMRRPIENNSKAGQPVYDPFMGSGSTLIAAEQANRVCYGVELNPAYVDLAVARWEKFTGQEAVLERDGRSFAQHSKQ